MAGNIGHVQAGPGQPVILADRLTAATSPLAAFAGKRPTGTWKLRVEDKASLDHGTLKEFALEMRV